MCFVFSSSILFSVPCSFSSLFPHLFIMFPFNFLFLFFSLPIYFPFSLTLPFLSLFFPFPFYFPFPFLFPSIFPSFVWSSFFFPFYLPFPSSGTTLLDLAYIWTKHRNFQISRGSICRYFRHFYFFNYFYRRIVNNTSQHLCSPTLRSNVACVCITDRGGPLLNLANCLEP
jgi:hypothetical protein